MHAMSITRKPRIRPQHEVRLPYITNPVALHLMCRVLREGKVSTRDIGHYSEQSRLFQLYKAGYLTRHEVHGVGIHYTIPDTTDAQN
jgi:hypothetical protein